MKQTLKAPRKLKKINHYSLKDSLKKIFMSWLSSTKL